MGRTCVCGAEAIEIDRGARTLRVGDITVAEGDVLSNRRLDRRGVRRHAARGAVAGWRPTSSGASTPRSRWPTGNRTTWCGRSIACCATPTAPDGSRCGPTPTPRTTPRTPERMGAEGIGLTLTEHMFLGERRTLVERLILAEGR